MLLKPDAEIERGVAWIRPVVRHLRDRDVQRGTINLIQGEYFCRGGNDLRRSSCLLLLVVTAACSAQLGDGSSKGGSDSARGPSGLPSEEEQQETLQQLELTAPLVRRLTKDELRFTLQDTLGVSLSEEVLSAIPADRPLEGFANIATSQTVTPEHALGYAAMAEFVAAVIDEETLLSHGTCTDPEPRCIEAFLDDLGGWLFRRPLDARERESFAALFDALLTTHFSDEPAAFASTARIVLRALLQSPQFLYRLELETAGATGTAPGQSRAIVGYEAATRLSYLAWASAPDAELREAAASGQLDTVAGQLEQLARLLEDEDKAARVTERYIRDWGRLEALPDDGGLRNELIASLVATYNHLIWAKQVGPLDVLHENEFLLSESLAENLGIDEIQSGIALYDVAALDGRVGLLSHPGLIAGMTNADGGEIVARGLFLQSQLFCRETAPPPPSIQEEIDAFVEELSPQASNREVAEIRLERPECARCHSAFDPLAYGFEQFDFQGRFRTVDEFDNVLATDGWIPAIVRADQAADVPYASLEDYAGILSQEEGVGRCLTQQHVQFALGRVLERQAEQLAEQVQAEFERRGASYQAMLEAIVSHAVFRTMEVE